MAQTCPPVPRVEITMDKMNDDPCPKSFMEIIREAAIRLGIVSDGLTKN